MLTAAVRDLKAAYPEFRIGVDTTAMAIWDNNPNIDQTVDEKNADAIINAHYPLIQQSNHAPYHFLHGFVMDLESKLGLKIPITAFKGDIHLSEIEIKNTSQVQQMGIQDDFWIIVAGGKYDFTAKWWSPLYFQEVIDELEEDVLFVQCGEEGHWHPPLNGVVNLVGKTDVRQFIQLVHHSTGVLCPVTFAMHLAAAVPIKSGGPKNRPCVVIAGGREPPHWEAYPHHRFLSTNGALSCCDDGGCWKSRCQKVGDGDIKDEKDLCVKPVNVTNDLVIAKCMSLIKPINVIAGVQMYYEGGVLQRKGVEYGNEKVNITPQVEIALCGLKRSGNHALLNWIASQFDDSVFFTNDASYHRKKAVLVKKLRCDSLPCLTNKRNYLGDVQDRVNLYIHSHEDNFPNELNFNSASDPSRKITIFVLRDIFNWAASSLVYRVEKRGLDKNYELLLKRIDVWEAIAKLFIEDEREGMILINYNRWFADEKYRDNLAKRIGVDNRTDSSLKEISGYGFASSFDGTKFQGKAQEMKVLERWKSMVDDKLYRQFMASHKEAIKISQEIFGNIKGTEGLLSG